jgi:hypothetical protein
VGALQDLSAVTSAVEFALDGSLAAYEHLLVEAGVAQELASDALVTAGTLPSGPVSAVDAYGRLVGAMRTAGPDAAVPGAAAGLAAAHEALRHAAAAGAAAEGSAEALAGVGVRDAFAPANFSALLARVPIMGPFLPPEVPAGRRPEEISAWWAGLSAAAQAAAIASAPAAVGARNGLPAWARDRANRSLLGRALEDPHTPEDEAVRAGVVARRIAAEEAAGQQVQLHLLDLTGDRVVLALGDLDSADAVALLVPGIGNSPADDLGRLVADARRVGTAARTAAPGTAVASVVWLGYRTPGTVGAAVTRTAAWRGGPALAASLAGLEAARTATGGGTVRTTVVAHSYGTLVVDEAADAPGRLAADAVVLLGSPGMEDDAASLEAPAVFDAAALADPISWLGWFGDGEPWEERYGATGLPGSAAMGHSDYFDPRFPTLAAIGDVVAGERTPE